jgi:hypothetical protein
MFCPFVMAKAGARFARKEIEIEVTAPGVNVEDDAR